MDFSDSFRCSATSPKCSPDGKYVAAAVEYRLIVRDVQSLQVAAIWSCLDKIEAIDWAPNSNHILCGLYSRALVQVWSLNDTSWQCKIDEGPAGVASARWSPCGGEIILCADFQIRITIWSLVDRKCMYLNGPKFPDKGFTFSPDGEHVAIAERKDCKDYIAVYATADWKVQNRFPVASTDLADISWAQDGSCISVADTLLQYKLLLYTPQGEELARYSAYDDALGIKDVTWAPHGQLISIGSYDQIARVLNNVTWSPFLECEHPAVISGPSSTTVYREVQEGEGEGGEDAEGPLEAALPARARSRYAICELPATIPSLKPERNKASPRLGVGLQCFSNDGQYLATRNDNMPQTVWIWDMYRLQLVAVLTQIAAVRDVCWAPDQPQLVLCTGSDKVFLWTPQGVSCVHIPLPGFTASSAMWMRSSSTMLLANKDMFCVVYVR